MTTRTVFAPLNAEWAAISTGPAARRAARRWGEADERLAGYRTPAALLEAKTRADSRVANEILAALIEIGDDLAIRAALEGLLPLAARHVRHAVDRGHVGSGRPWASTADLTAEVIAELWVWLHTHAGRPVTWPASRVQDRLRAFINGIAQAHRRRSERSAPLWTDGGSGLEGYDQGLVKPDCFVRCAEILIGAHRSGAIDLLTAQMLYGLAVRGDTISETATRLGLLPDTLQKRARRQRAARNEWVAA